MENINLLEIDWKSVTDGWRYNSISNAVMQYPLEFRLVVVKAIQANLDEKLYKPKGEVEGKHLKKRNQPFFAKLVKEIEKDILEKKQNDEMQSKFTIVLPSPEPSQSKQEINTDKPQQQAETKNKSIKIFSDCLHHKNKDALMKKLHKLLNAAKAKDIAITIQALINLSLLANYESKNNLYAIMRIEFELNCTNSGINKFLNSNNCLIAETEIKAMEKILSEVE